MTHACTTLPHLPGTEIDVTACRYDVPANFVLEVEDQADVELNCQGAELLIRAVYPSVTVGVGANLVMRGCHVTYPPPTILVASVEPTLHILSFYVTQKEASTFEWRDSTIVMSCTVRPRLPS